MILPFQYIQFLWLLLLIPVLVALYFYALKKKKAAFRKIGDEALVKELTSGYNTASFLKKFILVLAAMALILVSIANLRTKRGAEQINRNGIDVMIALDVSNSMLAQDVKPTRLDRAKQLLNKLIDRMGNNRVGLVVFAGKAYLQMPLTGDHSAAKMYLSSASPQTVPTQGTVIGDALKMSFASFNSAEKKYKAVILISDGEDRDENSVKIASQMAQEGVVIYTVGIGSPEGAPIMDEKTNTLKKDSEGNTVITKLNEQAMAEIAEKGNGTYQLYTNSDAVVGGLYDQLSTMDTRSVQDDSLIAYRSWFQYLLAAALLFLLMELFISEVKRVSRKKMISSAAALLLSVFFVSAQTTTDIEIIKKGNDAYKKADFETAVKNYDDAVKRNNANATAQYNLGNALYKADKKSEAVNAYDKAETAMKTPAEKSSALYNKGVALQNDKKTEDCIVAYKNALKSNPNNADARHNLQLALKQQKQDKKDNDDKDKQNSGGDKNEKPKPKSGGMSPKDAEQKLQALLEKEKGLQDKLHKVGSASPDKPEKDW